jgi:hypothetical protein
MGSHSHDDSRIQNVDSKIIFIPFEPISQMDVTPFEIKST